MVGIWSVCIIYNNGNGRTKISVRFNVVRSHDAIIIKNSMNKYKQGDILIGTDGYKRKILGVCGEVYHISDLISLSYPDLVETDASLEAEGYTLAQPAKWVPKEGEAYWYVASSGSIWRTCWMNNEVDMGHLLTGNVHRTREDAEKYKQRLIDWASKQ